MDKIKSLNSSEDEEEMSEQAIADLQDVHNKIKQFKSNPQTAGMYVSGWDDDDQGIEGCANPKENPKEYTLWAAENGEYEILVELIEKDAALINATDKDGYTPLHRASYNNHLKILNYLLSKGANVHAKTNVGWTPLHSACHWNHDTCAATLLAAGADVNALSDGGQTPLHITASVSRCKATLLVLLTRDDIDPEIENRSGEKARQIARTKGIYEPLFEMVEPAARFIISKDFTYDPFINESDFL